MMYCDHISCHYFLTCMPSLSVIRKQRVCLYRELYLTLLIIYNLIGQ